jgi:prefoldin beta subunit
VSGLHRIRLPVAYPQDKTTNNRERSETRPWRWQPHIIITFFFCIELQRDKTKTMASAAPDPNNPGNALASAVDGEVKNFQEMQQQLHSLRGDFQVVMGQQTENEMVKTELNMLDNSGSVLKKVGPVLVRQELDDAKETVSKRLEFIQKEKEGIEKKMKDKEEKMNEKAAKIQEMQSNMQRMTAQAVQAIQQQHQTSQG